MSIMVEKEEKNSDFILILIQARVDLEKELLRNRRNSDIIKIY